MGTRYICDVCGKEYDVKGAFSPIGYQISAGAPDSWAVISYLAPKEPQPQPKPSPAGIYAERMPEGLLVCSQACAERAFDEFKERSRLAFEKLAE